MADDTAAHAEVAPVMQAIARGMELKKCRKCGCMADALEGAARAFQSAEEPAIRSLLPVIDGHRARLEPLAYDCIGCRKCWGADATKLLAERFGDEALDRCGGECGRQHADAVAARRAAPCARTWPRYAGDYVVGNPNGAVAVCTLSNRELAAQVIGRAEPSVAIAGRCDTENIGVEKVVLNLLANPGIRWLLLCGEEAQGHRAGDAFLRLQERGVDPDMRVLESASWRPVLRNLTLKDVARFREQVEVANLIGVTEPSTIIDAARECAARPVPSLPEEAGGAAAPTFERIQARAPERLKLDPAGFFIVLPQPGTGVIVCEHYESNGRLSHVIEGRKAALIAATAVERGLISGLDHAAYLGRELAKAELALATGAAYEQDAALGKLPSDIQVCLAEIDCTKEAICPCH